ncbi:unnamed protein product [Colletotrichum noveboracense]|uniref:F-box domain-containing protein n=1 Tax=Colletotrichum noveboracense TaxID=2664923 RepID=A0A9W4RZX9_9PEZI|nr:hypothetical protein K456DRAFT_1731273 [Colletotrichum gloeosporioides 23]CAI0650695.1 unnamed protein product [Colletotrichum noveboracense]
MTTTSTKESSLMTAVLDREHENRVQSRLCALPEEVIADIMYQMREADLYFIRHVSHLFFRLFGEKRFSKFRSDRPPYRFHFSGHEGCTCQQEVQFKLLRLVLMSAARAPHFLFKASHANLCQPCLQRIPDRTELELHLARFVEKLRCSGCGEEHQRLWFSREQLFKLHRRKRRRCILWEGRVQLCSHVSFTWGHVSHWVEARHNPKPDGFVFLECKQCLDGVHGAKPPKVVFLVEQSTNGRLKREVKLSWTVPLSAVDGESPGQHSNDQLLCPHVTWTKVRTQALKQYCKDFTCWSCHSEYSFSTEEGGKETFVERRRLLWSNAQVENNYSRVLKVHLMDPDSYEIDTSLSINVLWCDSEGCFNANANPNFRFDLWVKNQNPYAHLRIFESYSCQGLSTTHCPWSSDMFKEFKLCSCKGVNYVVDDLHEQLCKRRRERLRQQQELYDKYPCLFVDYLERENDT